jgi:hypothetical protein
MNKRFQVFISSTFSDLKEERQSVLRAILELDHMPAGMELFPASDDSAWQLIKDVIDGSDYYVLIIGGRYGSIDETGVGYTEKEYDYAISTKKPVIPLLHEKPGTLPREKTETDESAWKKLESFRKKVEKKHTCAYWKSAEDLKAKVIIGVTSMVKRHPAIGWIRADEVPSEATLNELLILKDRIAELESSAEIERTQPPKGIEELYQGSDTFNIAHSFVARKTIETYPFNEDTKYTANIYPTWDEIFAAIAPSMISETSEYDFNKSLKSFFESYSKKSFSKDKDFKGRKLIDFHFSDDDLDTCLVQLRALGLIKESVKQRSVKDTRTYWSLTPYGDNLMVRLRALRRDISESEQVGEASPVSTDKVKKKK